VVLVLATTREDASDWAQSVWAVPTELELTGLTWFIWVGAGVAGNTVVSIEEAAAAEDWVASDSLFSVRRNANCRFAASSLEDDDSTEPSSSFSSSSLSISSNSVSVSSSSLPTQSLSRE